MEYLSALIADRMCKNEIIREDDLRFYAYSIQLLLERTIGLILIGIFALVFKAFIEIAVFTVVFVVIRRYSDGIHCKTSIGCFILSVLLALSTIPLTTWLIKYPVVCITGVLISMAVILVIGAIHDPNLDLPEKEFIRHKKITRILILIIGPIVLCLLFLFSNNQLVYYSALGIIYNALSLMAVKVYERRGVSK
ncbi:MAG: accessory gene regulator B family protein [Clostridiales bacterium]|nr:accessory gene regulator B family protein [Clostridiales bacterium]